MLLLSVVWRVSRNYKAVGGTSLHKNTLHNTALLDYTRLHNTALLDYTKLHTTALIDYITLHYTALLDYTTLQ